MFKLKQLAVTRLKPNSMLRNLILSEPDYLPPDEARVKVQLFVKMLYIELAQ